LLISPSLLWCFGVRGEWGGVLSCLGGIWRRRFINHMVWLVGCCNFTFFFSFPFFLKIEEGVRYT
jgi:hypothetical protein